MLPAERDNCVRAIHTGFTCGCHVDAPEHMVKGGQQIYQIPVDVFVGPAVIADMTKKVPNGAITAADLEADVGSFIQEGERLSSKQAGTTITVSPTTRRIPLI
jgi:kynurenine formamidase